MKDCIFCKIVKGDIPSYKTYEDENVIAFLDILPLSKGHTLVVPKKHFKNIYEISDEELCNIVKTVKKVSSHIKKVYNPEGIVIIQNNGEKAGQSIFHIHFHIKPIYNETKVVSEEDHRKEYTKEEMENIVKELSMIS